MQRRALAVQGIESLHPSGDAEVVVVVEQVPIERGLVVPFALLRELGTHEEQLLARNRVLVAEQQPQVRTFLPVIASHLRQQRALAVDDLVV